MFTPVTRITPCSRATQFGAEIRAAQGGRRKHSKINKTQMKFIFVLIAIFALAFAIPIWLQIKEDNRFNVSTAQCLHDKGVVSLTAFNLTSENYECIRDGQIIDHVN